MSLTPSNMLALGTKLPDITLPTPENSLVALNDCRNSNGLLVMFICNHCPYVVHIASFLKTLESTLANMNINCVAISSNDIETYPADSPDKMREFAEHYGFSFPYLFDESQEVARSFNAACTPDFYLFNGDDKLVYRGQMDDSRPNSDIPVDGKDIINAAICLTEGRPVSDKQTPSMGCNIKWK